MPRIYHPHTTIYRLIPAQLQLHVLGDDACPLLQRNFRRIFRNVFGENPVEDGAASASTSEDFRGFPLRLMRVIRWLNVTVIKECTEFPYLEMDESCALLLMLLSWLYSSLVYIRCFFSIQYVWLGSWAVVGFCVGRALWAADHTDWLACWIQAQKGLGSNRSCNAVG